MRALIVLVASAAVMCSGAHAQQASSGHPPRTLLAVFAHADDETMVGPLLAHYAKEPDTRVVLAIVTNGDQGVMPFANIPAGEQLAAVRVQEAECAAAVLGVEPPVFLGLPDGGLNSSQVLADAAAKLSQVFRDVQPDVIVTWGPDGGYGHPDHRLVSAVVTQLVQAGEATPLLYYAALPRSRLASVEVEQLRFPAPFAPVADELLDARVPYTPDDLERAKNSLACHESQFTPASVAMISALTQKIHGGQMHLRSWSGGKQRTDLFQP